MPLTSKGNAGVFGFPPDSGHTPWIRWATGPGKAVLTLGLGGAGGWLLAWLDAPAPWLTGSMLAVAASALSGLPFAMPHWMRKLAFLLLGISIGRVVTPEALSEIRSWPASILLLLSGVAATTAA